MSNKISGTIVKWNDEKGFGFIKSEHNKSIFFHISEYRPPNVPIIDEKVMFEFGEDKQGRMQAKHVQNAEFVDKKQAERQQRQEIKAKKQAAYQAKKQAVQEEFETHQSIRLIAAIVFYIILIVLALVKLTPWAVFIWYLVLGIATFLVYAKDKGAAQNGQWRTKESTLHSFALFGGWVGAMLAQTYLRHKSKKAEFRMVYYATILINLALLIGYIIFYANKY